MASSKRQRQRTNQFLKQAKTFNRRDEMEATDAQRMEATVNLLAAFIDAVKNRATIPVSYAATVTTGLMYCEHILTSMRSQLASRPSLILPASSQGVVSPSPELVKAVENQSAVLPS
jgi:hypothetical protein